MRFVSRCAVDTNILLRLSHKQHPLNPLIETALRALESQQVELCYTTQSLGEFWNASTRPLSSNGLGFPSSLVDRHLKAIESKMALLPEDPAVYAVWRRLLLEQNVSGVQVHDAHIAATLEVHGVSHLLTFNVEDFKRFPAIIAVHPDELQTRRYPRYKTPYPRNSASTSSQSFTRLNPFTFTLCGAAYKIPSPANRRSCRGLSSIK